MRQRLGFLAISLLLANSGQTANANPSVRKDILDIQAAQTERASSSVLTAVAVTGKRLVAVGERGVVLLSDDNGQNWRQAKLVPTSVTLTNIFFASSKIGWAIGHGGAVLKTVDSGETWIRQLDGNQAAQLELVAANAAANGGAETRRQSDAHHLVKEGADKPFLDVHFFDEQHGIIIGAYGLIFGTHDGGKTWISLIGEIDNPKGRHLYHITAVGQDVLITGEQGVIYRGSQAGQHFTTMISPYVGTLFGAIATPGNNLLVYGLRGNAFRSSDQGIAWTKVEFGLPLTLTAGTTLRDGRLVVVDETGRVMLSGDGGIQFTSLPIPKMNAATGVVEAADGSLVVSTQRGVVRIANEALRLERK
jgi:photosystem II stability/assembly factor-like uncharacterized protein